MENNRTDGIIYSVTQISEFDGKKKIGFKLNGIEEWFNAYGDDAQLEVLKTIILKGAEVSFEVKDGNATEFQTIKEAPKGSDASMIKISGKDYMTYQGLLDKAHAKKENFSMIILESYVSEDMKKAWCKVRLTAKYRTFDGFGSSTPENTKTMTQTHPVEMAHTRAKGRALRDYLNIGEVMAEELKK